MVTIRSDHIEIYLHDLNVDAQQKILEVEGFEPDEEGNMGIVPIATIGLGD